MTVWNPRRRAHLCFTTIFMIGCLLLYTTYFGDDGNKQPSSMHSHKQGDEFRTHDVVTKDGEPKNVHFKRKEDRKEASQQKTVSDKDRSQQKKAEKVKKGGLPFKLLKMGQFSTLVSSVYDDDTFIMKHLKPLNQIPPILHLSWKNDIVPEFAYDHFQLWNSTHSNWTFVYWKDEDVHKYVKTVLKDSKLYDTYKKFSKNIAKMDFSRYVILYTIGGVYADIDIKPLRRLEPVLSHHSCIIAREPEAFPVSIHREGTILASNFFMASRPGHPFWPFLMEKIIHRGGYPLMKTGPVAVTDSLYQYTLAQPVAGRESAVYLAPSLYFDPPHGENGKGDAIHIQMLGARCRGWKKGGSVGGTFSNRVCRIFKTEGRIDFGAMYQHPKYFNGSFVWHGMFNSWNSNSASKVKYKDIKTLKFSFTNPNTMFYNHDGDTNPYERERHILKHGIED